MKLLLPYCCQSPVVRARGSTSLWILHAKKESQRADSNRFPAHYECAVSGCCTVASHTTLLIFLVHASMITGATPLSRELVWRR
jgi:hypothetical protein